MTAFEPTLQDIASLLDAPGHVDPSADSLQITLWLIRQSPASLALYEELHVAQADRPTLMELAKLLLAVESSDTFPECRSTVLWLIRQSTSAQARYRELEGLVNESEPVPIADVRLSSVLANFRAFERLLQADESWTDAAEILDPTGQFGVNYEALLGFCQARLSRTDSPQQLARLTNLHAKLIHLVRLNGTLPSITDRLDSFHEWLSSIPDPGATMRKLEAMLEALRSADRDHLPAGGELRPWLR